MTDTLHITSTTPDDLAGLREVLAVTALFPPEMLDGMIAPAFAMQTEAFWLTARQAGRSVGLCYTEPDEMAEGTWNMLALAVHPDQQQQGLGKALVAEAEARLKSNGARLLIVDTSGTDAFANTRRFYAACGYIETARIPDYWAAGDDKLIFTKSLL